MDTILLITNIPTPYRLPLFNELDRRVGEAGFKLKVVFASAASPRRQWEVDMSKCSFEYRVLPSRRMPAIGREAAGFTYTGLWSILAGERPVAVISDGFSMATTKLWLRSLRERTIYIIWSGAVDQKGRDDARLRKAHRKMLIKRASGFIAYGSRARNYLASLGADPGKIHTGINTVDTAYFREQTSRARSRTAGSDGKKHLLSVGHFIPRKRIGLLLPAIKELSRLRKDFILHLVGDGPEHDRLREDARLMGIAQYVVFEGFRQMAEMPEFFSRADCFLFPTGHDIWGLVLVEAMAAGVPCITSPHAGAVDDLVEDGHTGFLADFHDTAQVAGLIGRVLDDSRLSKMISGNASRVVEEKATLEKSAEGFMRAIMEAATCVRL